MLRLIGVIRGVVASFIFIIHLKKQIISLKFTCQELDEKIGSTCVYTVNRKPAYRQHRIILGWQYDWNQEALSLSNKKKRLPSLNMPDCSFETSVNKSRFFWNVDNTFFSQCTPPLSYHLLKLQLKLQLAEMVFVCFWCVTRSEY